jgi:tRNA 2-thiocytidine biosynthesis protein TtcA
VKEISLAKKAGQAINDYGMILPDEHILLGVSGGIDSIALLSLLQYRLTHIPVSYTLHPIMIDKFNGENPQASREIEALRDFLLRKTGIELEVMNLPLTDYLLNTDKEKILRTNICFKCAQIRRSTLFRIACERGYTKVALGHHKDDIIETILMNVFYKREVSAMIPRLPLFGGKIELIRPLAYLDKRQLTRYVADIGAPVVSEQCPAKMVRTELRREKVRTIIDGLSREIPGLRDNIFAAFRNPKPDYMLDRLFEPKTRGVKKRP